jgi:hypothetical protein
VNSGWPQIQGIKCLALSKVRADPYNRPPYTFSSYEQDKTKFPAIHCTKFTSWQVFCKIELLPIHEFFMLFCFGSSNVFSTSYSTSYTFLNLKYYLNSSSANNNRPSTTNFKKLCESGIGRL